MPRIKSHDETFNPLLLNIRRIPELHGIACDGATIRIGPLTTVTEIRDDRFLNDEAAILANTADCFASGQVRNSATLGGNICNASPAGDMIIPLLLLDADVELFSWRDGELVSRTVPLCDFFLEPGKTVIRPNELLTSIRVPKPTGDLFAEFRKFGVRPAMDIAVVSVGVSGQRENGSLKHARIAFGAVAPVPLRGKQTEAAIEGRILSDEVIAESVRTAEEEISPISDVRASAWYRRELVRTLLRRILSNVRD